MTTLERAMLFEHLIKTEGLKNFYEDLEARAPKFFDFIFKIVVEHETCNCEFSPLNLKPYQVIVVARNFYNDLYSSFGRKIDYILSLPNTSISVKQAESNGGISMLGDRINVSLSLANDVRDPYVAVHEFGHAISQPYLQNREEKVKWLGEIAPIFFEKVFVYNQWQEGKISEEEYQNFLIFRQSNTKKSMSKVLSERALIKCMHGDISVESYCKAEKQLMQSYPKFARFLFSVSNNYSSGRKSLSYIIGEITAAALFEDYLSKPRDVLKRMDVFLQNSSELTEDQAFTLLLGKNYERKLGFSFKDPTDGGAERTI